MVGNPPRVSVPSFSERYFSPNGDSQEDTTRVFYCLSTAANLDVTVVDADGAKVRTLEDGVSHTGSVNCDGSYNNSLEWDGKDDAGKVVADGAYTVRLHAVDAAGQTEDATNRLGVDTRSPGALTSPAPGDTLAGLARFVFQPTDNFLLRRDRPVLRHRRLGQHQQRLRQRGPGAPASTLVSCRTGRPSCTPSVRFTDAFGAIHSWNGPTSRLSSTSPACR